MGSVHLQRGRKKDVEESEDATRLLAAETAKRENSTVMELLRKDGSNATLKAAKTIAALATSFEQAVSKNGELMKKR